jgi:topoisomerase IA-like protein
MELLIIAAVVVIGAIVYYNVNAGRKNLDLNQDGEVDFADVKVGIETARQGIAADIVKVKTAAKATVKKATAKKPVAKKPAAKKPVAKPAAKKK